MVPIDALLSKEVNAFIVQHKHASVAELMLRMPVFTVDSRWIAAQIEGWQKASQKLPLWASTENIIYPIRLSMEQCSSERTAHYKSTLMSGERLVDLTGGVGVDSFYLSKSFNEVIYIEQQEDLAEIAAHNFSTLNQNNIVVKTADSHEYLKDIAEKIDVIFLDPARRKEMRKVYKLSDCEPNVVALQSFYFSKADVILIKTSPMLDITEATRQLTGIKEIHVVSVDNECKEVLYLLEKNYSGKATYICAHDHKKQLQLFSFTIAAEQAVTLSYSAPLAYLYEPNPSILKAGGFNSITQKYEVFKLHASSHLYTSASEVSDFPGRTFKIKETVGYSKKDIQAAVPGGKANIQTRNFPDSVEAIRKKTGLKDGGNIFIFATTLHDLSKVLLICEKI